MIIAVTCLLAVPAAQGRVSERDGLAGSDWRKPTARLITVDVGTPSRSETCPSARTGLRWYQAATTRWYAQMDKHIQPRQRGTTCARIRRLANNWRGRARIARQTFEAWFIAIYRKWSCIHEYEGAWDANTGNGYYGGLQMTTWFQQNYGREFWRRYGTADRWPIWSQLVAAERAWRECECFRQWGTAGRCGLR